MSVHRFQAGDEVKIDHRHGYPSQVATARVASIDDYRHRFGVTPGYRIVWNYGRPREQYESEGGWMPASMILGYAHEKASQ